MSSNFCSCGLKLSHFPSDSYQLCWNLHKHFDERFHPRCVIHVTFCKLIEVPNGEDEKVMTVPQSWNQILIIRMTMGLFAKNSCKTHMYLYYKYTHWIDPCMMHKCWIYFHVFTFPFSSTAYKTVRLDPCATSWKSRTKERRLTKQILTSAKNSMGWKMCNKDLKNW